jgi:hypothetical protein
MNFKKIRKSMDTALIGAENFEWLNALKDSHFSKFNASVYGVWQRSWQLGITSPETFVGHRFQESFLSYFALSSDKGETTRMS